jgi:hypothetical protein
LHSSLRALRSSVVCLVLAALSAGVACSSDEKKSACEKIMDVCHEKDPGIPGNAVTDCHAAADEGDEAACQQKIDDGCIQTCENAPPPGEVDAGGQDHEADGGSHEVDGG